MNLIRNFSYSGCVFWLILPSSPIGFDRTLGYTDEKLLFYETR